MKDKVTPLVLALVAIALLAALRAPGPRVVAPRESEEVPNFTFVAHGRSQELHGFRGQVVVLNFWATWCPPCVAEIPSLERLHQRLGDRGVAVLGVNVDEDPAVYENFLRTHNVTFPNHRDPEKRIATLYGTFMYPETYIIDPQGRLVRKIEGALEWDDPQVIEFLTGLLDDSPGVTASG